MSPESNYSSQIQFIILCCKSDIDENDINAIQENVKATEHLEEVSILAYSHGVYPLFYHALINHASNLLDQETKDAMAYLHESIQVTNEAMTNELIRLTRLLKEQDIEVLSFKGPILAEQAYGNIAFRQYSDLDILCKQPDFKKIEKIFSKNNYKAQYSIDDLNDKTFFEFNNDCPFYNTENNIFLECHWDFFRKELKIPTEDFTPWKSSKLQNIQDKTLRTLSNENHLLFLAAHGCKHFFERIIWITDIDRMIRSDIDLDYDKLLIKAKKLGIKNILLYSLFLSYRYFKTPLPDDILILGKKDRRLKNKIQFFDDLLFKRIEDSPVGSFSRVVEFSMLRDNWLIKLSTLTASVLRPNKTDRELIQFDQKFYFLYWPFRIYRLVNRQLKRIFSK